MYPTWLAGAFVALELYRGPTPMNELALLGVKGKPVRLLSEAKGPAQPMTKQP